MIFFDENYNFDMMTITNTALDMPVNSEHLEFNSEDFNYYKLPFVKRNITGILWTGDKKSTTLLLSHLDKGETVMPIIFNFNKDSEIMLHVMFHQLESRFKKLLKPYIFKVGSPVNGVYETKFNSSTQLMFFYLGFMEHDIFKKIDKFETSISENVKPLKQLFKCSACLQHSKEPVINFPYVRAKIAKIDEDFNNLRNKYKLCLPYIPEDFEIRFRDNTEELTINLISPEINYLVNIPKKRDFTPEEVELVEQELSKWRGKPDNPLSGKTFKEILVGINNNKSN